MSVRYLKTGDRGNKREIDPAWADLYIDEERRQNERYEVELPVSISATDALHHSYSEHTKTENISLSGIYIRTDAAVPVNSSVEFAISAAGGGGEPHMPAEFHGMGNVVRVLPTPDGRTGMAIALDEHLQNNLEFAVFLNRRVTAGKTGC